MSYKFLSKAVFSQANSGDVDKSLKVTLWRPCACAYGKQLRVFWVFHRGVPVQDAQGPHAGF